MLEGLKNLILILLTIELGLLDLAGILLAVIYFKMGRK